MNYELEEELIRAWIKITSIIKNNRIFENVSYNEAIILNLVYQKFKNGDGIYVQDIIKYTKMLKSLVNRTLNSLSEKGFINKVQDKNKLIVYFNEAKKSDYLKIHEHTLEYMHPIVEKIGKEDIIEFIRIVNKIEE